MELADLFRLIEERQEVPPPPPIFACEQVGPDFWRQHFDTASGQEAWQRLYHHATDRDRPQAVITADAWERLLEQEKLRRALRLWSFDHGQNGARPAAERDPMRAAERSACTGDLWHWLNHHGWIETPHARKASARVAPLVYFPGQAALLWWLRDGVRQGRETGRTCYRHLLKSRKVTASWSACLLLVHSFLFERAFSAKLGSITGTEADDKTTYSLLGKLRFIVDRQPDFLLPDYPPEVRRREDAYQDPQYKILNRANGSRIAGETMTANFGRSGRDVVLWQDESASVQPSIQAANRAGRTSVAVCEWSTSTPRGRGNQFHLDWTSAADEDRLTLRWAMDPRLDDEWFESLRIGHGGTLTHDQQAQEYGCSFAGVSGLRIWNLDRSIVGYGDDTPEWLEVADAARRHWTVCGGMDFGEGPSATVYLHAILDWEAGQEHEEFGRLPRLWFNQEVFGYRVQPYEMAQMIHGVAREHNGPWAVYGDPAGKRAQLHQVSWESDLRAHGVPLYCLAENPFAQRYYIDKVLDLVNEMLDLGLIRVHESRCPVLLEAMEGWEWDVPSGLRIEQVNRSSIKWKKNGFSHFCEAAWYAVMGAIHYNQPQPPRDPDRDLFRDWPGESSSFKGFFGHEPDLSGFEDLLSRGASSSWRRRKAVGQSPPLGVGSPGWSCGSTFALPERHLASLLGVRLWRLGTARRPGACRGSHFGKLRMPDACIKMECFNSQNVRLNRSREASIQWQWLQRDFECMSTGEG